MNIPTPLLPGDLVLRPYQRSAVSAWTAGPLGRPNHGTVAVATGLGKTIIALACIEAALEQQPDLRVAVVVPTIALADQWRSVIAQRTSVGASGIGRLGGGSWDPATQPVVVAVLNSAAKQLPAAARAVGPLMLIVDECHRAGSPTFSGVLETPATFRLGLSATPEREDLDDDGQPLRYDEQLVGAALGEVVFSYTLKQARADGWLPDYSIRHHAIALTDQEREGYETLTRKVEDAADELRALGGEPGRSRRLSIRKDDLGTAARIYVAVTSQRKDLLFRAQERARVVARILAQTRATRGDTFRALLFHERVDEAVSLYARLQEELPDLPIGLEHSKLSAKARREVLADFAEGRIAVLISVKALIEGIDVPAADLGISVASTASVRQRIQSLGRVMRRTDDPGKHAVMHLLYVHDSADEAIYGRADWADLTGGDVNSYWGWPFGADAPEQLPGPPRTPLPSEGTIHEQAADLIPWVPHRWPGEFSGQEYSVAVDGTVHNAFGRLIANPQDLGAMIAALRGRPGGKVSVTPMHGYVLVWERSGPDGAPQAWVIGRLAEPLEVLPEPEGAEVVPDDLAPGAVFGGSADKDNGTFKLSQRSGGVIERRVAGGVQWAQSLGTGQPELERNTAAVVAAWQGLGRPASRFHVNRHWECWYAKGGSRHFLAKAPGGFAWPD